MPDHLLYDTPVVEPSGDRLGRSQFAQRLAESMLRMPAEEGFVFALNGPWGSGKTTLINFIASFLGDAHTTQDPLVIVRFNPWWFSGQDQLLTQFFQVFQAALGQHDTPAALKHVGQKLEQFARILTPVLVVPGVGSWAGQLQDASRFVGTYLGKVGETAEQDVNRIRESIDQDLREQRSRILVIIDDIDRLHPNEIQQVFQLVKAVADFPKTFYLLAFDQEVVVRALDEATGGNGQSYLEKIVQTAFSLPLPDKTSLDNLLLEHLEGTIWGTPDRLWDDNRWWNLYFDGIRSLIRTPRDVKRLINSIRSTYPLVRGEVHAVDFIGIEALRVFLPNIYTFVSTRRDLFAGADGSGYMAESEPQSRKEAFDSLLAIAPSQHRQAIHGIMRRLFPRWESAFRNWSHGSEWLAEWRQKRFVCSPDVFDIYFKLSLAPGDITSVEMKSTLDLADQPDVLVEELKRLTRNRINGTRKIWPFFDRLLDEDLSATDIQSLLQAIFMVADSVLTATEDDPRAFFDMGPGIRLLRVSSQVIKKLSDEQQRFEMLSRILSESESVSFIAYYTSILGDEHGRRSPDSLPPVERTVSEEHLDELEQIALDQIRAAITKNYLSCVPTLNGVLYRLADWGSIDEAKRYVRDLTESDAGLADYLAGFAGVKQSWGSDDRISQRAWVVDHSAVQHFLESPVIQLLPRCKAILGSSPSWLTDRQRRALEAFVGSAPASSSQS